MKKTFLVISLLAITALPAFANDGRVNPNHPGPSPSSGRQNTHVGQVDTDGILSPGEIKNPGIDYNSRNRNYDYGRYNNYDSYAQDRAYQQHLRDIERREQELAYEEQRRNDRSWWNW